MYCYTVFLTSLLKFYSSYVIKSYSSFGRQGDLLEQLKAQLLREQAGVDFSDIKQGENAMSSTGGDEKTFPTEELPHMVPKTTLIGDQRSTVDSTFQVQDLKAKNVNKRAKVRSIASSTSYRAMGEYDRDYMYDENSRDFTDDMNKKDEVEVGDVSRSGKQLSTTRTIVTIPLDLTDSGSAVHVMSELKRMGIDDKVGFRITWALA